VIKILTTRSPRIRPTTTRPRLTIRGVKRETTDDKHGLRFESRQRRREFQNWQSVANATEHLDHLPGPGCTLHAIMRGNYSYGDLIPAVLRLAAPTTLAYVAITTLGFSVRASSAILRLLDSGQIGTADFVCADFFEKADAEVCHQFRADLAARGSRFTSARCHAKVLLFKTTAGEHYTSESSANIRACRSIEQFAFTNDRELFDFHRQWIQGLFDATKKTTD